MAVHAQTERLSLRGVIELETIHIPTPVENTKVSQTQAEQIQIFQIKGY